MTQYTIIGTGITGFSAAHTLKSIDPKADVLLISDDPHGFYSRPGLAYLLSGEIPESRLFLFSRKRKLSLDVQHLQARVTRLEPESHSIELDGSKKMTYDRLLLATGASAVPLDVPGNDLAGLVKLDNLADARRILSLARHAKAAVVVGGGVVALEMVEGLVAQGIRVHYLLRGDWFWSNVLAEAESRQIEHNLAHEGVQVHHHEEIAEILEKRGKVTAVRTSSGVIIPCDIVAVGIGVRACKQLAQAAGLATDRGIQVSEYLRTSSPDIFAAGDVAQIHDPSTGSSSIDNLWYPGRKQGRIAALNMLGQTQIYQRTAAVNVLRLAGIMTTIIGSVGSLRDESEIYTTRGSSETWRLLPNAIAVEGASEVSHLRLTLGGQALQGAVVMGDQKISRPIRELIDNKVDITPIRERLLQSGSKLGQLLLDYWLQSRTLSVNAG